MGNLAQETYRIHWDLNVLLTASFLLSVQDSVSVFSVVVLLFYKVMSPRRPRLGFWSTVLWNNKTVPLGSNLWCQNHICIAKDCTGQSICIIEGFHLVVNLQDHFVSNLVKRGITCTSIQGGLTDQYWTGIVITHLTYTDSRNRTLEFRLKSWRTERWWTNEEYVIRMPLLLMIK